MRNIQELMVYKMQPQTIRKEFFDPVGQYVIRSARWKWLTWFKTWIFYRVWSWCEPCRVAIETKMSRIAFDKQNLLNLLKEQEKNLFEVFWQRDFSYVVLGHKQWMQLVGEVEASYLHFHCPDLTVVSRGQSQKVIGIDVLVVPWIDGIFLLPKLPERKDQQ